ncbi:hypothetical protein J2W42_006846 [Rhizobium tibeticum]|nr:hypothetical protein [Rhizobium tibeticum]
MLNAVIALADTAIRRTMPVNRTLYLAAAVAALLNLSTFEPAQAASSTKQSSPTAVSKQHTASTTPTTNGMLTPRMMDRKRPMNPICAQGFKPRAPSSCHY